MALYLETVATANSYEYPDGWRHWVIAMARALKSLPFIGYMARTMLILDGRLGRWEYVKRGGAAALSAFSMAWWPVLLHSSSVASAWMLVLLRTAYCSLSWIFLPA